MKTQNPGPSGYTPLYLACQQGHMYEKFNILVIWLWHWFVTKAKWFLIRLHPKSAPTTQIQATPVSEKRFLRNPHFTSWAKGATIQARKLFESHSLFLILLLVPQSNSKGALGRRSEPQHFSSFLGTDTATQCVFQGGVSFLIIDYWFNIEPSESLERKCKFTGKQPISGALAGTWSKSRSCCIVSC